MANQRAVNGGGCGRGRGKRNAADADASVSSAFLNSHATNRTRIVPGVIGFMRLVTNSVTLDRLPSSLPLSPSLSPPLEAFTLLSMPTKLELIIVIIIGISVKCDLNLIILNYFVTCISFSFSISFSFPFFFLDFLYSECSVSVSVWVSHPMPRLIPFGFVTFPVRFRFDFDSFLLCLCFLFFFFYFLLVHSSGFSAQAEPLSLSSGRLHLFDWNWFLVSRWGFETRLKNHNNHNHIVWHCIVLCSILVIFSSAQLDLRLKC